MGQGRNDAAVSSVASYHMAAPAPGKMAEAHWVSSTTYMPPAADLLLGEAAASRACAAQL